jgi:hypothetical protein
LQRVRNQHYMYQDQEMLSGMLSAQVRMIPMRTSTRGTRPIVK